MRFIIISLITILLLIANIFIGSIDIPYDNILAILLGDYELSDPISYIILGSRIPQSVTALLAGAGLAVTGLMLQTAFRNPLAGPSILGISSGASLGVALVMLLFGGSLAIGSISLGGYLAVIVGALIGSLTIMAILIACSARVRNDLMLLIIGIMTGYLTSSLVTLLSSISSAQSIQGYVIWGMGTFSGVSLTQLPLFSILTIIGLVCSALLSKPLNILLLGDNYARNLGVNVVTVRNLLLLVTGILTAVITAYCGPVAFIGLAIPHVARMIWRTDNHWVLMPGTMLCGAAVALACNLISVLPQSNIIPINALTPLVGVPVIIYVIVKRGR
jgi:iron complex transport system permease protein